MEKNIITFLLKNGVKPEDLESIKVALEEEQQKEAEKQKQAEKRLEAIGDAYDDLVQAWFEYVLLRWPKIPETTASRILETAIDSARKVANPKKRIDPDVAMFLNEFFGRP